MRKSARKPPPADDPFRSIPACPDDLAEIWDYTAQRWDMDQADHYIRRINEAAGEDRPPNLGRSCDDIREGYRKYPVGSHLLFCRVVDKFVAIIRILHTQMDFESHLP